ncbi:MAG: hypothetical protein IPO66_13585 [Rhodanobacteraceae bacterium]|nr:hypothetical protein [Rhodanobacteraceae bacterium]
MKSSMRYLIPLLATCAIPCNVAAWEVDTHAWITLRTFERSNLNASGPGGDALITRLGFDRFDPKATFRSPGLESLGLGTSDKYFDLLPNWDQSQPNPVVPSQSNRFPNNWEYSRFPEGYRLGGSPGALGTTPHLRLEAWLMRGVIREDDLDSGEYISAPIPDPDPYGDKTRVFGHFYDPINNDGIPDFLPFINEARVKAINWATGLTDALSPTPAPLLSRDNHFTWVDARRAYFKALTYQTANATQSSAADGFESEVRLFFLATTIKAIGQVVHILQDGSQPQHARIDRHNHSNVTWDFLNADLPRRLMEVYTNIRVTRDINLSPLEDREPLRAMFTVESGNMELPALPPVGAYPIPQFSLARRFFTTREQAGGDDYNQRKGLIDYANRGFFSEGTANGRPNLKLRVMPSPPVGLAGTQEVPVTDRGRGFIDIAWNAPDTVSPGYADALDAAYMGKVPLGQISLRSIINESQPIKVSIRERHLRNHANVLIPRAIAYSAGLINYFFRGTLEIEPIEQKMFAVVNQGEPHTIDAGGWPRKTAPTLLLSPEARQFHSQSRLVVNCMLSRDIIATCATRRT